MARGVSSGRCGGPWDPLSGAVGGGGGLEQDLRAEQPPGLGKAGGFGKDPPRWRVAPSPRRSPWARAIALFPAEGETKTRNSGVF